MYHIYRLDIYITDYNLEFKTVRSNEFYFSYFTKEKKVHQC